MCVYFFDMYMYCCCCTTWDGVTVDRWRGMLLLGSQYGVEWVIQLIDDTEILLVCLLLFTVLLLPVLFG